MNRRIPSEAEIAQAEEEALAEERALRPDLEIEAIFTGDIDANGHPIIHRIRHN